MSTISQVAAKAGVSRTTVSHVLNHADRVSPHLRERVQAAIAELGYVPNPQAQSLRTGRTNIVALLVPDIRNPFYSELIKVAQTDLEALGRDVMIFNSDVPGGHPEAHNREYLRQIKNKRVDGLIVADYALHGMHDELLRIDIPTIFIGDLPSHAVDSVKIDDYGGGYQLGTELAKAGHRKVLHITGPNYFREAMARASGFETGFVDNGGSLEGVLRFEGSYLPPSGIEAIDWLQTLQKDQFPSAIFFSNYLMAVGGLARLYDHDIKVPDDLSVVVFGDQPEMEYSRPKLTRVGVKPGTLADKAVQMLAQRIDGEYTGPARIEVMPTQFITKESLAVLN